MTVDGNKRLVEQAFARLFNRGELALADELVSVDFLNHEAPPEAPRGPAGLRQIVTMLRTAFPDLHIETEELIAEGDKVVARTTLSGTHRGPYFGIAPTGRRTTQEQIHILRFVDGKAVEHWAVRDDLGLLQQLGVLPAVKGVQARERVEA
jgi:predicted ester cyclase